MNWTEATTLELCHIIMWDEKATEEEKQRAGQELFSRIGDKKHEM